MKKIAILIFIIVCISSLLYACSKETNENYISDIGTMFPDRELSEEEKSFIKAVRELNFEDHIGSDRRIIYTCSDESKGFPSQISFAFNYGNKYTLWGLSIDIWHGDFILDDDKVILFSNPDLSDPQEKIVFDITDGKNLSFNAEMSCEDAEYELVIVGPDDNPPDLDGMTFEPDAKKSMQYNFDGFA